MAMTEVSLAKHLERLQLPYFVQHDAGLDGSGGARVVVSWPLSRRPGRRRGRSPR